MLVSAARVLVSAWILRDGELDGLFWWRGQFSLQRTPDLWYLRGSLTNCPTRRVCDGLEVQPAGLQER